MIETFKLNADSGRVPQDFEKGCAEENISATESLKLSLHRSGMSIHVCMTKLAWLEGRASNEWSGRELMNV